MGLPFVSEPEKGSDLRENGSSSKMQDESKENKDARTEDSKPKKKPFNPIDICSDSDDDPVAWTIPNQYGWLHNRQLRETRYNMKRSLPRPWERWQAEYLRLLEGGLLRREAMAELRKAGTLDGIDEAVIKEWLFEGLRI